ncbi:uncharacterized protein V1510DRAFT_417704 [Dipodascopsis tothii]|uniref:uncharacterized protein n=1 Tax=Dipodascopsis tothii TaxID=44089 RepID=UPI0034CD3B4F
MSNQAQQTAEPSERVRRRRSYSYPSMPGSRAGSGQASPVGSAGGSPFGSPFGSPLGSPGGSPARALTAIRPRTGSDSSGSSTDGGDASAAEASSEAQRAEDDIMETTSTSSYAGSDAETLSDENLSSTEYVTDKLLQAFDAVALDKAVVTQAKSSGLLNSKARDLQALQERAAQRMQDTRYSFVEGIKNIKDVQKDLRWVQKHVDALKKKTAERHPTEYAEARELIPEIIEFDD